MDKRTSPIAYLVGENPRPRTLVFAASAGLFLAVLTVVYGAQPGWGQVVLFLLSFDIAAGWVSNLSASTRHFWRQRSRALHVAYVVAHLTVYPLLLWTLIDSLWIRALLLLALLGKLSAFVVGLDKSKVFLALQAQSAQTYAMKA